MTLWQRLTGHRHEFVRERRDGRLWLTCSICRHSTPFGWQSFASAPQEPSKAVPKPKRERKAKAAPVLPIRRVK